MAEQHHVSGRYWVILEPTGIGPSLAELRLGCGGTVPAAALLLLTYLDSWYVFVVAPCRWAVALATRRARIDETGSTEIDQPELEIFQEAAGFLKPAERGLERRDRLRVLIVQSLDFFLEVLAWMAVTDRKLSGGLFERLLQTDQLLLQLLQQSNQRRDLGEEAVGFFNGE